MTFLKTLIYFSFSLLVNVPLKATSTSVVQGEEADHRSGILAKRDSVEISQVGVPLIHNFPKSIYKAENQNWSVACAPDGALFFGNNEGLLHFDGAIWQTYPMPGNRVLRSIAIAPDGRIYAGGYAEFGYWEKSPFGKYTYKSLSRFLDGKHSINDEIWKIYVDGERVIFQSFSSIYTYSKGKLHVLSIGKPFLFLLKAGDRYFVEVIGDGLHEYVDNRLRPVKKKELIGDSHVMAVLPHKDQLLVATSKKGLFSLTEDGLSPWENQANAFLVDAQLNNGIAYSNNYFIFGTILDGLFILDHQGRLTQHINKDNGLQNNSVLSLATDKQGSLWAGLDNGIDRVELRSPLSYYSKKTSNIGTVYATCLHNGYLYVGTNQGLYVSPWQKNTAIQGFDFQLVPNTQGQVWDLSVIDGYLLCGHNIGTFKVEGLVAELISKETGGYMVLKSPTDDTQLVQGTYTGMVIYVNDAREGWRLSHRLKGFNLPAQYIQMTGRTLWASSYKGLYRILVDQGMEQALQVQKYDERNGLPKSLFYNVFDLGGKTIFATEKGFFVHDDISDFFSPYTALNDLLGSFAGSSKLISAGNGHYWFIKKGRIAKAVMGNDGKMELDSASLTPLNSQIMAYYENINTTPDHFSIIGLDNGFALYWENNHPPESTFSSLRPDINRVEYVKDSISKAYAVTDDRLLRISNKRKSLLFNYAIPYYANTPILYQYRIAGYSTTWSAWQEQSQKEITNLSPGTYTFIVRAKNPNGIISKQSTLRFEVLPPWFLTWPAYLFYLLLIIVLILFIRKWYAHKLYKHQRVLTGKLEEEQRRMMQQKQVEAEKREARLRNEQLERELAIKNRELANSSMNIVYKNELLNNVHDELLQLKDEEGRKLSNEHLKKINKIIEDARSDERDWMMFEESFNEAHGNFFKKLKTEYPGLLPNDLKLCAYLRMNMSSKEIASLLNISTRGVEIRRYRMRKKLGLHTDQNLTDFLLQV